MEVIKFSDFMDGSWEEKSLQKRLDESNRFLRRVEASLLIVILADVALHGSSSIAVGVIEALTETVSDIVVGFRIGV